MISRYSFRDKIITVFLSLTLLSGYWYPYLGLQGIRTCFISQIIGFDCLGCGMTRSFLAMGRFSFREAFSYNWAGPLVYFLFLILLIEKLLPQFEFKRTNFILYKFISPLLIVILLLHWIYKLSL